MIAPVFEELSNRFAAQATFLKVDVDVCRATAASQNVSSMPTFVFYRSAVELARIQGANPGALESKIRELGAQTPATGDDSGVPGHMDLSGMMLEGSCECLNESDEHPLKNCLKSGSAFLESDCDEQLIINLTFSQAVKLHSISIKGPNDKGPKNLRLFINQPRTLDFDQCSSMESVQDIEADKDGLEKATPIPLRFVKFQNVLNLLVIQLFINKINLNLTQMINKEKWLSFL
jgi:thiol-disulfide isomerase/thioredoxin